MSKRAGDEWRAPLGCGNGVQGWSPAKIFASTPLGCKKTLFLSIKMRLLFDLIGYILFNIIH